MSKTVFIRNSRPVSPYSLFSVFWYNRLLLFKCSHMPYTYPVFEYTRQPTAPGSHPSNASQRYQRTPPWSADPFSFARIEWSACWVPVIMNNISWNNYSSRLNVLPVGCVAVMSLFPLHNLIHTNANTFQAHDDAVRFLAACPGRWEYQNHISNRISFENMYT